MNSRESGTVAPPQAAPETCPLSEAEIREVRVLEGRLRSRPLPPRVKIQPGRGGKPLSLKPASLIDNVRLMAAFGTTAPRFADRMLSGLLNAACNGGASNPPSTEALNEALAAVAGIGPPDETEAMLATQMVATHFAAMTLLRRLKGAENISQQDSAGNLATKLLRSYAMQVEALTRYRGKGQQKVTVEHVHVHSGGQAIVGAVQGDGVSTNEEQPHAPNAITNEPGIPMRGADPERETVPVAGGVRGKRRCRMHGGAPAAVRRWATVTLYGTASTQRRRLPHGGQSEPCYGRAANSLTRSER